MNIYFVRKQWVILDKDLANLIGRTPRQINQTSHRNHLSSEYCFQITPTEYSLIDANYTNKGGHSKKAYSLKGAKFIIEHLTRTSIIKYKELAFEKQVVKGLIAEGFIKQKNKPSIHKQIPDYIFKKGSDIYIVEIQVGILDKNHLYRLVEYRDLYYQKYNIKPKLLMVCEGFKVKHNFALKIHKIQLKLIQSNFKKITINPQTPLSEKESLIKTLLAMFSQNN